MSNAEAYVDKDGISYHLNMVAIYLEEVRIGVDKLKDIEFHLSAVRLLFDEAELAQYRNVEAA